MRRPRLERSIPLPLCLSGGHGLEVEAEADLQAYLAAVVEIVKAEMAVDGGLDGDMLVQEEAVAHLGHDTKPVLLASGFKVLIEQTAVKIDAAVLEIIADISAQVEHMR